MPAVDVAMRRSLRGGFLDFFVASLRPALQRRDLAEQISDVGTAFSSWDNCMLVDYCKWPVIALIIIGGLIIISVVWCIIRCACCGLSCCCSCFSCLKCCGDCCGCCDPPRGSRRKYLDEPYIPPNHGYKSQEPMHAGFAGFGGPTIPPAAKAPDFPQYATFDAGGKKNEDALPEMPSWEGAEQKKVLVEEEEAVEMNALKKPETSGPAAGGAAAAAMGGAVGAVSPTGSRSPANRSPYGPPDSGPGSSGYFAANAAENDPYAQGAPAYNQPGMSYREPGQGYGIGGGAMGPGRRSPRAYANDGYNDGYSNNAGGYGQARDYPSPGGQGSYDNYGAPRQQPYDNYDNYNAQPNQGYGIPRHQTPHGNPGPGYGIARHQTPHEMDNTPYPSDSRRSPAPQGPYDGGSSSNYGAPRGPPQRQYSSSSAATNHNNNYSNGMHAPAPLRNDGGFDFTSGFSRPPARAHSPGNGYRQAGSPIAELGGGGGYPAPQQQQQQQGAGGGGYPGYKPYQ